MKTLDEKVVKEIANETVTSEAFFLALGMRERNREEIDFGRTREHLIHEGFKVNSDELAETLRKLDKAGVGHLVMDKSGRPTKFKFHFRLKEVARAALGDQPQKKIARPELKVTPLQLSVNTTVVVLSDHRSATISIPSDLTEAEAKLILENTLLKRA